MHIIGHEKRLTNDISLSSAVHSGRERNDDRPFGKIRSFELQIIA